MLPQRFWDKVAKFDVGCWYWCAGRNSHGYGTFRLNDRQKGAHRLVLEEKLGRALGPHEKCMHACDNRACCNPEHLSAGSRQDNVRDRDNKGQSARGTRHSRCKLTEDQVRSVRSSTASDAEEAKRLGINGAAVWLVRAFRNWKHLPLGPGEAVLW